MILQFNWKEKGIFYKSIIAKPILTNIKVHKIVQDKTWEQFLQYYRDTCIVHAHENK